MLIQPKKTKYRKYFKPRNLLGASKKTQNLAEQNCYALITKEPGYLNSQQVEAARQNIRRRVKKEGKLYMYVFADLSVTKKSSNARMGKGKGKPNHWIAPIKAGQTILNLYGIDPEQGIPALRAGANKLPMKVKIYKF